MRLSNGFVIDKEKTFGELKFTAVRDVFLQNEDGTPSTQLKKRIYDLKCSLHGGIIPVSVPPEVPLWKYVLCGISQGAVADLKNVCSSHEFIVETIKADDAEYLSSVFTDAQLTAKDTLLFLGEQFKMFEVLEFITEHKILISKIERVEPSLESLFMEVVSK